MRQRSEVLIQSAGLGLYRVGDRHRLLTNRYTTADAPAAIWCHGANGTADDVIFHPAAVELARRGVAVLGVDAAGVQTWGNDVSLGAVSDAHAWLQAQGHPRPVVVMGGSMGSVVALSWARAHLADVIAVEVTLPIGDLEACRAEDRFGFRDEIELAFVNLAGWNAARPTHNPIEFADELAAVDLPVLLHCSTTDNAGTFAEANAFAAAVGPSAVLRDYGPQGHTYNNFGVPLRIAAGDWLAAIVDDAF